MLFKCTKILFPQVCVHIVQAIRKEASVMRDEWEARLCSAVSGTEVPDTYCFEMLSMVLALSGSAVGRSYLAHQHALLTDLLTLLHTGSARVQRQVGFSFSCLYLVIISSSWFLNIEKLLMIGGGITSSIIKVYVYTVLYKCALKKLSWG